MIYILISLMCIIAVLSIINIRRMIKDAKYKEPLGRHGCRCKGCGIRCTSEVSCPICDSNDVKELEDTEGLYECSDCGCIFGMVLKGEEDE